MHVGCQNISSIDLAVDAKGGSMLSARRMHRAAEVSKHCATRSGYCCISRALLQLVAQAATLRAALHCVLSAFFLVVQAVQQRFTGVYAAKCCW
jgi:hypothetical protein